MGQKEKDIQQLMDVFLRKGHASTATFGDEASNPQNTLEFMRRHGMDGLYKEYHRAQTEAAATLSDSQRDRCNVILNENAQLMREKARNELIGLGIDLTRVYEGEDPEKIRATVRTQLSELGMGADAIDALRLDNIEELLNNDRAFTMRVHDRKEMRDFFEREGFEYTLDGDMLEVQGTMHVEEGVTVDDSPENRKILDDNEIEYILMAQGRNPKGSSKLFIPHSWDAFQESVSNQSVRMTNRLINSQLAKDAALFAGALAATALLNPAVGWMVFIAFRKSGLMKDRGNRGPEIDLYKEKALRAGLTVLTTQRRGHRNEEVYLYSLNGNVCAVPARDVRIPEAIKGVRLSADQRERFRMGELVTLRDKKGEAFQVRIDITQPDMVREYYKVMRSDKETVPKPTSMSPDRDKLDYISRRGYQGVLDIWKGDVLGYGGDRFLKQYGLYETFEAAHKSLQDFKEATDTAQQQKCHDNYNKFDADLKDLANNLVISHNKGMGR